MFEEFGKKINERVQENMGQIQRNIGQIQKKMEKDKTIETDDKHKKEMEQFKQHFLSNPKLNSFVACTLLMNTHTIQENKIITNNSYIRTELTNGLHMMNATYLYTNPPP